MTGYVSLQYIYEIAKIKKEIDPDMKKVAMPQIINVSLKITQMIMSQLSSCGLDMTTDADKPEPIAIKSKV